jgi:lysophospholipase L1-like esterase
VAFVVALAEAVLRCGFMVFVHLGPRPNCGVRPELLGRLQQVYVRGRPSPAQLSEEGIVADPHRGYRHAPDLRNHLEQGVPVSTNSRGMRGVNELRAPRPASVARVIALGDSFTFGEGVADDATWPSQLEAALPDTEVANLGERAYAHDQMYFALRDDGLPLQPDAVILGFYENDRWRDELSFYCSDKPRFSRGADGWRIENVPVPSPWDAYDRTRRVPLLYALPQLLREMATLAPQDDHSGEDRAEEILRQMRAMTDAAGARFVLVSLPDHPEQPPESKTFFHDYCARTAAECVDPWPAFRTTAGTDDPVALRNRYQRPQDIHYSREGYAVVAEALRQHFAARPILRASP